MSHADGRDEKFFANFAAVVDEDQCWANRRPFLEALIKGIKRPIAILEIGTWFGEGSTSIWLEHMHEGSSLTLVDAWRPYSSPKERTDPSRYYEQMDGMTSEAFINAFLRVRSAERRRGPAIDVNLIRGSSTSVLPLLASNSFDLIYIDGDHKYPSVKSDIVEAKRLARDTGSIIAGDDLEKMPSEELAAVARENKDIDYVKQGHNFHPGVLLAVHEEFGKVNMQEGFWYVVKKDGRFGLSF